MITSGRPQVKFNQTDESLINATGDQGISAVFGVTERGSVTVPKVVASWA